VIGLFDRDVPVVSPTGILPERRRIIAGARGVRRAAGSARGGCDRRAGGRFGVPTPRLLDRVKAVPVSTRPLHQGDAILACSDLRPKLRGRPRG